jgi:SOS regulatory protein LexA
MPAKMDLREKIQKLRQFYRRERRVASYSEMAKLFGCQSKHTVYKLVLKLQKLGYVQKKQHGKLSFTSRLTGGLKVLGTVQAGFPSPAEEELVDLVDLNEYLIRSPESTYMLTVSGDSMTDAGIQPGDTLLVERGKTPRPNDIVVAQVDEEWTLKYFGKDAQGIYLDPANKKYQRIRPARTFVIGGIVIAVIRKYRV